MLDEIRVRLVFLFCFVFRFCYHKSHRSCSWWFQKLSQPFYPIFLVGKITKKCYYSSSLNSGRCLIFFHFITAASSPFSFFFCGRELLLLPKATVLMGSLKVKTQKETACDSETEYLCCHPWFCYCLLAQTLWKLRTLWYMLLAGGASHIKGVRTRMPWPQRREKHLLRFQGQRIA